MTNSCQPKNRQPKILGANPCTELETGAAYGDTTPTKRIRSFRPVTVSLAGYAMAEGFAIDSAGHIFVTQHGRDQLHANWPELYKLYDEATQPGEEMMLLKSGGDYGWPECYYDAVQKKLVLAPEYGGDGRRREERGSLHE